MDKVLAFGLTKVDPAHYQGWNGDCPGCDLDAERMVALFKKYGWDAHLYLNEQCTKENVVREIIRLSLDMAACDQLLIYVSCHGGQVKDINGDEEDGQDETICLWDGQLVDDNLEDIWNDIPRGVDVVFFTDSCNSKTNFKMKPRSISRSVPVVFTGSLLHLAGCDDGASSYGGDDGGVFTNAWLANFSENLSWKTSFDYARTSMPRNQIPYFEQYGFISEQFKYGPIIRSRKQARKEKDFWDKLADSISNWWKEHFGNNGGTGAVESPTETEQPDNPQDTHVPPPALKRGRTLAGYGRVNAWATSEDELLDDIMDCKRFGVDIYHIEFLAWNPYELHGHGDRMEVAKRCYGAAISECRKLGMWLFVSFANSNTGSGKYGDAGIPLSKMGDTIEWAKRVILDEGPDNVLFQPMAETGGDFNGSLESTLAREFKEAGFLLVNNKGSRPNSKPSWASWNAWHPFGTGDSIPADQIIVSDTGKIIQELCYGLEGRGKPDTTKAWAKSLKKQGVPAVVFYHFKYAEHDEPVIKAMGEGVKSRWYERIIRR